MSGPGVWKAELDDSFFLPLGGSSLASNNYGYYVRCMADKCQFVSNNWLFDLNTQLVVALLPDRRPGGHGSAST